ncbi:LVIVD repeat-containing protein [Streptomonospora algeriensis]|uniref:LVIVD repeat-containing protein n=1 Tax=Streptomonospora algeriensis TaxID=995084 RepID=A0ABW3BB74_9ACTN
MSTSPWPLHSRRGRLRTSAVALAGAAALAAATAFAPAASADSTSDDVVTSENVTHLANLPKEGPFASFGSFNSDLAFTGDYAIDGNYNGFTIYDISDPESPQTESQVLCQGGQGDVSVSGDLLYFSVDYPRAGEDCGAPQSSPADADAFEGIRIFDISDKSAPEYVAAVRTDCGSHTNTLVPGEDGTDYIYVSSYSPSGDYPNCQPPHDKISVIEVDKDAPSSAAVVNEPVLFPEGGNEDQDGLLLPTTGCHDITVLPKKDIAAGACMGDGVMMDISDPVNPRVTERVTDDNFAFYHSATFSNTAKTVIFTDELGGGGAATCNEDIGPKRGADAVYSLKGKKNPRLEFESYFKLPRHQADTENCVAHNGSLIPVPGKDYFVQSWYQGGVSIIDFNDPENPREIGYFDRGPLSEDELRLGGSWSAYYYNGHIYSSDIQQGFDVLKLDDHRLDKAEKVTYDQFNPQSQPRYNPGA